MGRPRQPVHLLEAKGRKHLTKAEIEERKNSEIDAPAENIRAPNWFPEELKGRFDYFANILVDLKIMTDLDCDALARYVAAQAQWEKITANLLKRKRVTESYIAESKLQERYFRQAEQAAKGLGLTITSRCNLVLPQGGEEKPENKFSRFAKGVNEA